MRMYMYCAQLYNIVNNQSSSRLLQVATKLCNAAFCQHHLCKNWMPHATEWWTHVNTKTIPTSNPRTWKKPSTANKWTRLELCNQKLSCWMLNSKFPMSQLPFLIFKSNPRYPSVSWHSWWESHRFEFGKSQQQAMAMASIVMWSYSRVFYPGCQWVTSPFFNGWTTHHFRWLFSH